MRLADATVVNTSKGKFMVEELNTAIIDANRARGSFFNNPVAEGFLS